MMKITYAKSFSRTSLSHSNHIFTTHGNRPALCLDRSWFSETFIAIIKQLLSILYIKIDYIYIYILKKLIPYNLHNIVREIGFFKMLNWIWNRASIRTHYCDIFTCTVFIYFFIRSRWQKI